MSDKKVHNYVCFGTGYGTGTAPVYGCKICRHIPNWKLFFAVWGGDNEYKVYSDIEDTRSSNRVEPPNSICTAVRVGGVRIGLKQEASTGRWHE